MLGKLRGWLVLGLVGLALGLAVASAWAEEGSQAKWIRTEKLRAVYTGPGEAADEELVAKWKEAGLNAIICKTGTYDLEEIKPAITAAEKYGLHFFLTAFFRGGGEMPRTIEKGGRLYVREDGQHATYTGCPRDVNLWEATIFDRAIPLAEYGVGHPLVAGFLGDIENYGAYGESEFNSFDYCYCEGCLGDFLKTRGMNEEASAIPAPERKKWLESRGLLEAFKGWEHQEVERVCREERAKVDAINPDFMVGAYPYLEQGPFDWDMARGLVTEKCPFLTLDENTYGGTKVTIPQAYEEAAAEGVPILYAPGIWPRKHTPIKFVTHFYLAATMADGYWLYLEIPRRQFFLVPGEASRAKLTGTPEEWNKALIMVNREIDRYLADPNHQPDLFPADPRLPREMTALSARRSQASSGVRVRAQSWANFYRAPWKGGQVLVSASGPGGSATFDLGAEVPADRYQFSLFLAKAPDHGIVQTYVDGQKMGGPVDCYSARRFVTDELPLEGKVLLGGQREITFRIVGKNPRSSGYNFGVAGYRLKTFAEFAKDWMVLGPFPNPDDKGLDIDYLEGWQPDGAAGLIYIGKGDQKIEWKRAATQPDRDGYLNLATLFTDNTNAVAYAYTWAKVPEMSQRRIWVGADDGMRVWVNGKEALYSHIHRGASPDYAYVDLDLNKGWNSILFAVDQGTGDWGLFLRISDPNKELKYSAVKE